MRIISVVPSITKTLFDLGLENHQLIGRTKFCIHPAESVKTIEIIGGTKNLNVEKIKALKPDLILANKEENVKEQIEELAQFFRVWVSDVSNLKQNDTFMWQLGMILKKQAQAEHINQEIATIFSNFQTKKIKNTAYLIWQKPFMTVGGDTFINEILENLGFENIFKNRQRYPEITLGDLEAAEIIFLSTEPFPFQEKHIDFFKELFPEKIIKLVDGEAFSWFGSHISTYKKYYQDLVDSI